MAVPGKFKKISKSSWEIRNIIEITKISWKLKKIMEFIEFRANFTRAISFQPFHENTQNITEISRILYEFVEFHGVTKIS